MSQGERRRIARLLRLAEAVAAAVLTLYRALRPGAARQPTRRAAARDGRKPGSRS